MLVNHAKKIISVSVPKTGSTSLHYALMDALNVNFETNSKYPAVYHLTAEDIQKIMGPDKFSSYFSFGVTRNPFDRMVSLFHDFHGQRGEIKEPSFEKFVLNGLVNIWKNDVHFRPQTFFLNSKGEKFVSKAYRFEDGLDNILGEIIEKLQLKNVNLGHARKSNRSQWQNYYSNPQVSEVIRDIYKSDFESFGYSFEAK